jgi:hypothetical protein
VRACSKFASGDLCCPLCLLPAEHQSRLARHSQHPRPRHPLQFHTVLHVAAATCSIFNHTNTSFHEKRFVIRSYQCLLEQVFFHLHLSTSTSTSNVTSSLPHFNLFLLFLIVISVTAILAFILLMWHQILILVFTTLKDYCNRCLP